MAYVNVKDWSTEQVTDWLKGLDSSVAPYIKSFVNNEVKGHHLLSLRSDDLEHLGVLILGHQEIILEAVERLRNFHYELEKENLQMLALKLSCAANSLTRSLPVTDDDCKMVPTQVMSDVHTVIQAGKPLVCWLDRSPFYGDKTYMDIKAQLLELAIEMATSAHRDRFSDKPLMTIRNISESLAKLADNIIQTICDPMILQTAFLALATLKKKEQELGFYLVSSCNSAHQIAEIKYGSPAHVSTKIEEGDEIVQVNYQTVVGWQRKKVLLLLQESPPEIVLTLKKRPRHTKVYGQIYMKPYRLPSKKRAMPYSRWNDNLPSPQLLAFYDLPAIPIPRPPPTIENRELELESSSSSDSEPLDSPLPGPGRVYPLKPRPVLQRRHTITGASPISKRPYQAVEKYWQHLKNQASSSIIDSEKLDEDSAFLRDKSVSFSYGLELGTRPTTVLGIAQNKDLKSNHKNFRNCFDQTKKVNFEDEMKMRNNDGNNRDNFFLSNQNNLENIPNSVSVTSLQSLSESLDFIDERDDITDRSTMKNEWEKEIVEETIKTIEERQENLENAHQLVKKDESLSDVHVHNIIKKFDQKFSTPKIPVKPKVMPRNLLEKPSNIPVKKPSVPPRTVFTKPRGTLNKSQSTPAYDLTDDSAQNQSRLPEISEKIEDKKRDSFYDVSGLSNKSIKYEIGIPVVEAKNLEVTPIISINSSGESSSETKPEIKRDMPPKPPPRFSTTSLSYKPRYPDPVAPKPKNNNDEKSTVEKVHIDCDVQNTHKSNTQNYSNSQQFVQVEEHKINTETVNKISSPQHSSPVIKIDTVIQKVHDTKVSPTNSVVRAFYPSKHKANKKKNSLIAKKRKVSVKDVSPGELSGYLCQRLRSKQIQNWIWEKRWFILSCDNLYGFKNKESTKAECLIFLSGYTVSIASEINSRPHAFKVYHTGTVFYFSAENSEMLTTWMEELSAATLHSDYCKDITPGLYSETDESDTDQKNPEVSVTKQSETSRKFGSLKKLTSSKPFSTNPSNQSSSLDRKSFFKSSCSRTPQPVPTEQFRSYCRKPESVSTGNFTSHVPNFSPSYQNDSSVQAQNVSAPNLVTDTFKRGELEKKKPAVKVRTVNYVHASNPNLFDMRDIHMISFHKLNPFQQNNDSLAGFVTLEELMNRQKEEQKLNPNFHENINVNLIQPDVVYGEISIRPKEDLSRGKDNKENTDINKKKFSRTISEPNEKLIIESPTQSSESTSFCFGKRGSLKKKKIKKESNITEDVSKISWPSKCKDLKGNCCTETKKTQSESAFANRKLLKQKEYSASATNLERSCAEALNENFLENAGVKFPKSEPKKSKKVFKQHSFNSDRKNMVRNYGNSEYGEKTWFEQFKKTDKVSDKNSSKVKLKSAGQYTPMSLPLTGDHKGKLNAKFAFELNLDDKGMKSGKSKGFFSKHNDGKKEKTFFGSPKLHRAVFGKNKSIDHSHSFDSAELHSIDFEDNYIVKETIDEVSVISSTPQIFPSTDYPGLEYPPVFEPETYSLTDPNSSISLLRKQDKNNQKE